LEPRERLTVRQVNKLWSSKASDWLRLKIWINFVTDKEAVAFLQLLQTRNGKEPHPFAQFVIDLWSVSWENVLMISRSLEYSYTSLSLSAFNPDQNEVEEFLLKDISTKIAILFHGASNLGFLSIRTDYEVEIGGILLLVLSRSFPRVHFLEIQFNNSDLNSSDDLLKAIMNRAPFLDSVDMTLPEDNRDAFIQFIRACTVLLVSNLVNALFKSQSQKGHQLT